MDNNTLVVFVHEFGNLRVELDSVMYCNLNTEHSYLVDVSKEIITWVTGAGFALLDVNVFPAPFPKTRSRSSDDYAGEVLTYLWDNYIQLTDARRVIFIGHGPGCEALMGLMRERATNVMRCVQAVVQVVGNHHVPVTPADLNGLRSWYYENSMVIVPSEHNMFNDQRVTRKHGKLFSLRGEIKPIKLIMKAMPLIKQFVTEQLGIQPRVNSSANHIS